ncbi:hypothetical protein DICVIV_08423 [Dictyocaulus viviparus]|uniref:Uncharacterized protein n=1 Tax=Dictyocaulus viviparus TaxID=29172 RepID=A0A0D8XLX7_DICVI|nr:hypothetical protein DICVIV_08423 [Dictyocaulus viviparus]
MLITLELDTTKWSVPAKTSRELDLYVHRGLIYSFKNAFADIVVVLNLTNEDTYDLYKADNCSVVQEEFRLDNRLFGLLKGVNVWRNHQLNLFNHTFVGISTTLPYTIHAEILQLNYIRLGVFVAGLLLFIFARNLVRNSIFFYTSGCSFGLLASILIVVFIIYRMAPKTLIRIPFIIGGWSLSLYFFHFVWKNLALIAVHYQKYVVVYFVVVLAVSFAICYIKGPPVDSRSHDIAQWTLQAIALVLIYSSVQVQEISFVVILALFLRNFARSWIWRLILRVGRLFAIIWWKFFPPKHRLLTKEEYEKEGREVTKRELERLREFCRSPEADVWKLTCRVRNPRRLAQFVSGNESHILTNEENSYDDDLESLNSDDGDDHVKRKFSFSDEGDEWEERIVGYRSRKISNGYVTSNKSHESLQKLSSHSPSPSRFSDSRLKFCSPMDSSLVHRCKKQQSTTRISSKRRSRQASDEFLSSDSESGIDEE